MISNTCNFSGRLGNNLFQLSNLITYSLRNNTNWKIPWNSIYWVDSVKANYEIPFDIFEYDFSNHFIEKPRKYFFYDPKVFNYKNHPFWLRFLNVKFNGHYLSYKYFDDLRDVLIDQFYRPTFQLEKKLDNFIVNQQSVAVSVRRGDFLKLQDRHTVLDMEYYQKAINSIENDFGVCEKIYVFSDDLEWCMENFREEKYEFITGDLGEQFFLMTKMKRIILSNSTFAWWGAYLSRTCDKVLYPANWYGPVNQEKFSYDLFPPKWQIIY
jgi:hypothetical protein